MFLLEIGDHGEIFEGSGVSANFAPGADFLKEAAHDFPAASFGEGGGEADFVRFCNGTDGLADVVAEFLIEIIGGFDTAFEGDERDDALAFDFVGAADDGGFGDGFV